MSVRDADTHKLALHPRRVAEWLDGGKCFPLHVEIGLTNRCNHSCRFCTLDWVNHGKADLDSDVMMRAIGDFAVMGVKSIYFAGEGEPTLHRDLRMFLVLASSLGIKTAMSTNGSMYDKNLAEQTLHNLSWIRFSLDAGSKKTYSDLHGVKGSEYAKVLKNIADTVKVKKNGKLDVDIGVQVIFTPDNAPEIETIAKRMRRIGVDNFQVKPAHNHPNSSYTPGIYNFSQEGLQSRLEALETKDFTVVVRVKSMERLLVERSYRECHGFHFYALISATGDVVPCNVFYRKPEFVYGNLYKKSFRKVWIGDRRTNIIRKIAESDGSHCGNYRCRLDVMNRHLQRVKYPERNDEFI